MKIAVSFTIEISDCSRFRDYDDRLLTPWEIRALVRSLAEEGLVDYLNREKIPTTLLHNAH